jgi:hypothetical protein
VCAESHVESTRRCLLIVAASSQQYTIIIHLLISCNAPPRPFKIYCIMQSMYVVRSNNILCCAQLHLFVVYTIHVIH